MVSTNLQKQGIIAQICPSFLTKNSTYIYVQFIKYKCHIMHKDIALQSYGTPIDCINSAPPLTDTGNLFTDLIPWVEFILFHVFTVFRTRFHVDVISPRWGTLPTFQVDSPHLQQVAGRVQRTDKRPSYTATNST